MAVEHQRFQPAGEPRAQHGGAFGAAHRGDDAGKAVAVQPDKMLGRITEPEAEQGAHRRASSAAASAALHSSITSRSASSAQYCSAQRASRAESNRPSEI